MSRGKIKKIEEEEKAARMVTYADDIKNILDQIDAKMQQIGVVEENIAAGTTSATMARDDFDRIRASFYLFHDQVINFATDIRDVARTMSEE